MTYPPQPEPFSEALGEAAQTAAMAYRLMMTITDAVRRATQKRLTGKEEELGEDAAKMAPGWSADQLRGVLGEDVLAELMRGEDWPVMARQLVGLQQAGVDLGTFLPQMGRMTAGVHQAVVANAARTKAEGTDKWADLLKATMPEGQVRDAILSSPAWPDIAADMGRLDAKGIDVTRILVDAHAAGAGVDQAVAAVTTAAAATAPASAPAATAAPAPTSAPASAGPRVPAPAPAPAPVPGAAPAAAAPVRGDIDPWAPPTPTPAPAPTAPAPARAAAAPAAPASAPAPAPAVAVAVSEDARRSWGPLTEGLKVPMDLNLGDRVKALEQLGVEPAAHAAMVSLVRDVLPEHEAGLLLGARNWPLLAARMQQLGDGQGQKVLGAHLARLGTDTAWKQGPASGLVGRLVEQTHHALTAPLPGPVSRVRVSPGAARRRSTTTSGGTAPGQPAPADAAVRAHRQQAAPAKGTGRTR
ncbi:hypothetical protein [Streptomyces sp. NPDC051546]|uniref:hypothetical protein n=1 Tax=Streptomyces sp. NPDC051546 TaxID=3365655 RepID=UPI0037A9B45B